jgi:hypothetical protein
MSVMVVGLSRGEGDKKKRVKDEEMETTQEHECHFAPVNAKTKSKREVTEF